MESQPVIDAVNFYTLEALDTIKVIILVCWGVVGLLMAWNQVTKFLTWAKLRYFV